MSRSFSVLLVEDHDPLRQILLELLSERGWQVHPTDHGAEALEMARRIELDFGILDMHLPGGNGLELWKSIAADRGPLPAIMMSGEATRAETAAALQAGVFSFLRKPLEMPELQRSLDLLIQRYFPPILPAPPGM